jgi:hypothetical protein
LVGDTVGSGVGPHVGAAVGSCVGAFVCGADGAAVGGGATYPPVDTALAVTVPALLKEEETKMADASLLKVVAKVVAAAEEYNATSEATVTLPALMLVIVTSEEATPAELAMSA